MDYINAAEITKTNSVQDATHKNRDRTYGDGSPDWQHWASNENAFAIPQRIKLVAGFAISIRRGENSSTRYEGTLAAGTADIALSCLATVFNVNNTPDPRNSIDRVKDIHLQAKARNFRLNDPKEIQQKVVTPDVIP